MSSVESAGSLFVAWSKKLCRCWPGSLAGVVVAGLVLTSSTGRAGVFNEPQGHGVVIVQGLFDTGDRVFDRTGKLVPSDRYAKREGSVYLQYGITDWLMAIVKPDVVSTFVRGGSPAYYTGFGTSVAGAQVQLPSYGPYSFALQGTVHLPAYDRPRNRALVGNTTRDTDFRGLVGRVFSLGPWPGFAALEAGYRMRGALSPDEIHLDLTGGVRPWSNVLVLMQSFTTVPTEAGAALYPRTAFSNLEASVVYDLNEHWSVQVGVFATVFGRNALQERGVDTAVWYRF